jgi:hypothetical protein
MMLENNFHIGRSLYVDQVLRWLRFFPPEQFHFVISEEFEQASQTAIASTFEFLGVDPSKINTKPLQFRHHVRDYPFSEYYLEDESLGHMDEERRRRCLRHLQDMEDRLYTFFAPFNEYLFDVLARAGHTDIVPRLRRTFQRQ